MNISERIVAIINHYNLKAGDFAASINVAPATISNIKNGKTGITAQIAQKITNTYPELNFQWILLGEGSMFQSNDNQSSKATIWGAKPHSDELFPVDAEEEPENSNLTQENVQPRPVVNNPINKEAIPKSTTEVIKEKIVKEPAANYRSIEKIIIYYSDKTFEEYDMTKCKL